MNEKKYQVFISSTYSDLVDERKNALDILLMADCIPAGMEAFVATDSEQFKVIKKVIDLCDYYILIIGKRYGSINPETGLSYTEMEYDYAIEQNIPVLVFALDEAVVLPVEKTETNVIKQVKLKEFRNKALNNRLASIWHSPDDLNGKLAIAIMKAVKEIARPGWQRGTDYDEASLRREIMEAQSQIANLSNELNMTKRQLDEFSKQENLAFENCDVEIAYYYYISDYRGRGGHKSGIYKVVIKLEEIFKVIGTELMDVAATEELIERTLKRNLPFETQSDVYFSDKQLIKRLLNQFRGLGLITSSWNKDNKKLYWSLTEKGKKIRDDFILIRVNETQS